MEKEKRPAGKIEVVGKLEVRWGNGSLLERWKFAQEVSKSVCVEASLHEILIVVFDPGNHEQAVKQPWFCCLKIRQ